MQVQNIYQNLACKRDVQEPSKARVTASLVSTPRQQQESLRSKIRFLLLHYIKISYAAQWVYQSHNTKLFQPISGIVDVVRDPLPIGTVQEPQPLAISINSAKLPLDMALMEPTLPETEVYNIQLKKDDLGLGITVAGYVCEKGKKVNCNLKRNFP